ncbi:MAG: tetraacyldisaccharide 4'-kinase [Bacteroidaceae bacterium]|nr:tetraacyldisaccharide 4'-kinase [Bacteroidaceae bacterium]
MAEENIKIYKWLYPIAALYGVGVNFRNLLFDWGILRERSFDVPVICIGNITVGGTGKTPHTEYLIKLLRKHFQVAVLSRGYKRKSRGFLFAGAETPMAQVGDEPYQIKQKFPDVHVAVDANRCRGIGRLCSREVSPEVEVVLLDDAYQHRYVKPGINLLLVDYHRLIKYDALLPAGRLREPESGKNRADIVIVTKCPRNLKPMDYRLLNSQMSLYPYQQLYFSTISYGALRPLSAEGLCVDSDEIPLASLAKDTKVLLLSGIASPTLLQEELEKYAGEVELLAFPDHHDFSAADIGTLRQRHASLGDGPKLIVTTEKDATRLVGHPALDEDLRCNIYVLPIEVEFLQRQQETFNEQIIRYVRANSRNSILHKTPDAHRT